MPPKNTPPQLRRNRLHHWFLLLWWLCYHPERVKAHDEQYHTQARYPIGNHLVNTLAWMPVLIGAVALSTRPMLALAWNRMWELSPPPYAYPFIVLMPYILIPPLFTRIATLDRHWAGTFAGMATFFMVFNILGGVLAGIRLTPLGGVAFVVAAGIAGAIALVTSSGVVYGVMLGTAFAITCLVGFSAGESGILVFFATVIGAITGAGCVASVLANGIQKSIQRGELTRINTAVIPLMLTVYGAIAWLCFITPPIIP